MLPLAHACAAPLRAWMVQLERYFNCIPALPPKLYDVGSFALARCVRRATSARTPVRAHKLTARARASCLSAQLLPRLG